MTVKREALPPTGKTAPCPVSLLEVRNRSVALVIPMFNEELNIEHAMNAAIEACTKYADDYEIIIVDDASTDRSPFLVACRAIENPRIRMIRHKRNRRLGGALKT